MCKGYSDRPFQLKLIKNNKSLYCAHAMSNLGNEDDWKEVDDLRKLPRKGIS